ncbi:MAG: hypothetical protein RR585_01815 [Coprobacillus sp.]
MTKLVDIYQCKKCNETFIGKQKVCKKCGHKSLRKLPFKGMLQCR